LVGAEPVVALLLDYKLGLLLGYKLKVCFSFFFQLPLVGKPNGFALVEWNRPNGRRELEATSVKRVVVKGSVEAGAMAEMQYKGEIWSGKILSLHGKCNVLVNLSGL